VRAGEKVAVIGPSGSGKTTLLNLLAGILVPDSGTIHVNENNVSGLSDAERRNFRISNIGFVFQEFELIDYLDVLDNILHPYRITRSLKLNPAVRAHAGSLAERMGIGDKLTRAINRLSQGEKQRVAICRALLPAPGLILADEATGNLDPRNKGQILDLLFQSVIDHEATLLAVTHDHELLPRFDRVIDFRDFRQEAA
jgi:putative ABC transport system ATP-binding protein